ncbi:hypothetical protein CCDG5_1827 [[Clostridium] cellulosi]|uniref:Uncharacterized protein n=1 Tax=[Clostridium] cellulosi TaxID=29343 RepID=A0A078KUT3_9FIRM|nr:hypothetical protein CCDG5_1827 [[Clostridium] cellulosi]
MLGNNAMLIDMKIPRREVFRGIFAYINDKIRDTLFIILALS